MTTTAISLSKLALALLLVLVGLLLSSCVAKPKAVSPQYAAVTRQAEDITKTINLAQADGKEIKRLQRESLTLLQRLDYKTTILLK